MRKSLSLAVGGDPMDIRLKATNEISEFQTAFAQLFRAIIWFIILRRFSQQTALTRQQDS